MEYNTEAGPTKYLVGTEQVGGSRFVSSHGGLAGLGEALTHSLIRLLRLVFFHLNVYTTQGAVMSINLRNRKQNNGITVYDMGAGKHHGPIYSIQVSQSNRAFASFSFMPDHLFFPPYPS